MYSAIVACCKGRDELLHRRNGRQRTQHEVHMKDLKYLKPSFSLLR